MNRLAILACSLLVAGACALAQQPPPSASSPASGTQGPANQPSKNQDSASQSSAHKDSTAPPASAHKTSDPSTDPPTDDQESSSRDTRIDTAPPQDDAKNHPNSQDVVSDLEASTSDVQEFHPWNPYRANKDIQVGNFYFNRKNYKGALERYKDALYYKENDAVATFRAGECDEKLGNKDEARKYFELYLKILPEGPLAKEAHSSLAKLEKSR
jgi:tetratricopeptide (TPR) repeat protein